MKASMKYKCEDCYKSEKSCKCEKDTECENCGKGYNDSELLDGEMSIGETVCPHCKACVHTMTRYLDCDNIHDEDCEEDCDEHCHWYGDHCDLIICCACGEDCN